MSSPPPHQDRVERRDRALALRRKIKAVAGAGGVAGVGLVGYFVAASAPTKTVTPAAASLVRTVTTVITVGDDGVISKKTTTSLSPGTATPGAAASAVTVSGGSTVAKKP